MSCSLWGPFLNDEFSVSFEFEDLFEIGNRFGELGLELPGGSADLSLFDLSHVLADILHAYPPTIDRS